MKLSRVALLVVLAAGCSSETGDNGSSGQCALDADCAGGFVCQGGRCVQSAPSGAGAAGGSGGASTGSTSMTGGASSGASSSAGGASTGGSSSSAGASTGGSSSSAGASSGGDSTGGASSSSGAGGTTGATVSGDIFFVNVAAAAQTSVILTPAAGFAVDAARTQPPPGPKASGITGHFAIPNVPAGDYLVLAAFENDLLVRDPDPNVSGTAVMQISVGGSDVAIPVGLKVTAALAVVSPDNQTVSGTPTFVWADDAGEDHYAVAVFDAQGTLVWEKTDVLPAFGGNVSVAYGGAPLIAGALYRFRATSISTSGAPMSQTEDLRGTFVYQ